MRLSASRGPQLDLASRARAKETPMDPTASAAEQFLRDVNRRSGDLRVRAEIVQAELAAILETGRTKDGLATVTVGAGGIMRDVSVQLSGSITPALVNRAIMRAYQEGCRLAAQRATDIMARHAPGSPAVAMMRDAIPPDPEDDTGDPRGAAAR
jgi:hypothetical protein